VFIEALLRGRSQGSVRSNPAWDPVGAGETVERRIFSVKVGDEEYRLVAQVAKRLAEHSELGG